LITQALLIFPFGAIVKHRVHGPFKPEPRRFPEMIRYGIPCVATALPQMLNIRLDQMLMAAVLPPRDLGLYVVAVAWSGAVAPLLTAVGAVTLPAVASAGRREQAVYRLAAAARGTSGLAVLCCAGLAALTPFAIVTLFTESFAGAIPAAMVLVPAAGVLGITLVLQEGLRGLGQPYAVLKTELAGLAATALGLATMLRPMGIVGAALASLFGYSVTMGAAMLSVRRNAGIGPADLLLPKIGDIQTVASHILCHWRMPRVSISG
jgi:O-antigen/teichoic acid export membrane protein